jgi:hypothetical protein
MSTIALPKHDTATPARAKIAAGLALPLGVMTLVGTVIFWDWSWLTWVGVWGGLQGAAALIGAVKVLGNRSDGVQLLRYAMVSGMVFTVMKLVFWQELEAASFGVLSAVIYALLRERRDR